MPSRRRQKGGDRKHHMPEPSTFFTPVTFTQSFDVGIITPFSQERELRLRV